MKDLRQKRCKLNYISYLIQLNIKFVKLNYGSQKMGSKLGHLFIYNFILLYLWYMKLKKSFVTVLWNPTDFQER